MPRCWWLQHAWSTGGHLGVCPPSLTKRLTKSYLTMSVHASPFSSTMVGDQESGMTDCTTQLRLPEPPLLSRDMALLRMLPAAQSLNRLLHAQQLQQREAKAQAAATFMKCRRISLMAAAAQCCSPSMSPADASDTCTFQLVGAPPQLGLCNTIW